MTLSQTVEQTIASGLAPIEAQYVAIRSCSPRQYVVGYLAEAVVNSVELGVLRQRDFASVLERADEVNDIGLRFTERFVCKVLAERKLLPESDELGAEVFVAVQIPVCYLLQPQFYDKLKALLRSAKYSPKEKASFRLCFAFDEAVLGADVQQPFHDLALLGVDTMLICNKDGNCPLFRLANLPTTYVVLPPQTTHFLQDRTKPGVSAAAISYVHSVNSQVIATDVDNIDRLTQLSRLECEGALMTDEKPFAVK